MKTMQIAKEKKIHLKSSINFFKIFMQQIFDSSFLSDVEYCYISRLH